MDSVTIGDQTIHWTYIEVDGYPAMSEVILSTRSGKLRGRSVRVNIERMPGLPDKRLRLLAKHVDNITQLRSIIRKDRQLVRKLHRDDVELVTAQMYQ